MASLKMPPRLGLASRALRTNPGSCISGTAVAMTSTIFSTSLMTSFSTITVSPGTSTSLITSFSTITVSPGTSTVSVQAATRVRRRARMTPSPTRDQRPGLSMNMSYSLGLLVLQITSSSYLSARFTSQPWPLKSQRSTRAVSKHTLTPVSILYPSRSLCQFSR